MLHFTSGAIMMGFFTAAIFFLRFWSKTKDRLFAIFSLAFVMMAVERICFYFIHRADETRTWVYLIRLIAFALIIIAILDKNRKSSS